jgi:hypothetical protein
MIVQSNGFVLPVFARGTGLGNRLFQWARARVVCYEHGAVMIAPIWVRPAIWHLRNRTVEFNRFLGQIALVGLFRRSPRSRPFWHLVWLWLRCAVRGEKDDQSPRSRADLLSKRFLYLVNGRDDSFHRLNRWHSDLIFDFYSIVQPRHLITLSSLDIPPIGINIRMGKDFKAPPSLSPEVGYHWVGWLQQTPLSWFVETLLMVRMAAGASVAAMVVSDGSMEDLHPLLSLPNVSILRPTNAAIDLLALSRTNLLLGSGSSTFSAWAAFLGQQVAISAPGHPFTCVGLEPLNGQCIAAFDPRDPDKEILAAMKDAVVSR